MPRFAIPLFGALLIAMTLDASAQNLISMPSGLKYKDDVVGTGPEPKAGQSVNVHYTGWLDQNGQKGTKFDSSRDRGSPSASRSARARSSPAGTRASRR
jgi:peptidylprolyl isomerase